MSRLLRLAVLSALLPVACDGCRGCSGGASGPEYPSPLRQPPRPHEGPTTQRWSGPCWRDFATPDRVGASTELTYDGDGFITRVLHKALTRGGWTERARTFERGSDGATVDEFVDAREPRQIRYRVTAASASEPVLVEPREEPALCVCPADASTICWLGPRVFCLGGHGTVFARPEPWMTSCITCGERIEVDEGPKTTAYVRLDDGIEARVGERSVRYQVDLEAELVRERASTGEYAPEHAIPFATLKAFCAIASRRCNFDEHGNLLEFVALDDDGKPVQRDVLSYTCRERADQ